MDLNEYQKLAHKTSAFANDLNNRTANITMAMLGLCGEAGEVADHFKKWKFHGHAIDMDKLSSEIGDVMWYVAELCSALDLSLDEVAASNIAKLKLRYGEAFSSEKSINRSE